VPAVALAGGVPLIVGARFGGASVTICRLNEGSDVVKLPSLTRITMPETFAEPTGGVPVRAPVLAVNVAQLGRLVIENVSVSSSGSSAVGAKV